MPFIFVLKTQERIVLNFSVVDFKNMLRLCTALKMTPAMVFDYII